MITDSLAMILRQLIIDVGEGSHPVDNAGDEWPVYVGSLPEDYDEAICVYDTSGTLSARMFVGGNWVRAEHPGFQIRVRAREYDDGYEKLAEICEILDSIQAYSVTVNSTDYVVYALTRTGTIMVMGLEPGNRRRFAFTVNGVGSITVSA